MKYAFLALATLLTITATLRQAKSMDFAPATQPTQVLAQYWRVEDRLDRVERELDDMRRTVEQYNSSIDAYRD